MSPGKTGDGGEFEAGLQILLGLFSLLTGARLKTQELPVGFSNFWGLGFHAGWLGWEDLQEGSQF